MGDIPNTHTGNATSLFFFGLIWISSCAGCNSFLYFIFRGQSFSFTQSVNQGVVSGLCVSPWSGSTFLVPNGPSLLCILVIWLWRVSSLFPNLFFCFMLFVGFISGCWSSTGHIEEEGGGGDTDFEIIIRHTSCGP